MAWTVDASGTQATVLTTEHILDTPTTVATYEFVVDTHFMQVGDLVELRIYDMVDGSNYRQAWKGTFQHVQTNPAKKSPPVPITTQGKFTIKQTAGVANSFPWVVRRI
jgi:hypothetical protein